MRGKKVKSRDARAWALARSQHGVVARQQLLELGFDRKGIQRRFGSGRLYPLATGIYVVGRRETSEHGRWMAAVLACGEAAALSHRSAGKLLGICTEPPDWVDITIRGSRHVRRRGLRPHNRPSLPASSLTIHCGIPVTTAIQTLIDLATELPDSRLERAVNEADKRDRVDPEALRAALDTSHADQPGVKRLRALLDRDTFRLSDDELERRFRPIAAAAGLPVPRTKVWVNRFEVDFHWPHLDLVVETDGLRYHRTPAAQAKDARRDQAHTAAGTARLRFTHWQVAREPAYVRDILTPTRQRLEP